MTQSMKLTERVVFVIFTIFLVWYLSEAIFDFKVSGEIPLAFIAIFMWGIHILVQYVAKSEISVAVGWSAPAGELNAPARQRGAVFGVFICLFALYGYFAGWFS